MGKLKNHMISVEEYGDQLYHCADAIITTVERNQIKFYVFDFNRSYIISYDEIDYNNPERGDIISVCFNEFYQPIDRIKMVPFEVTLKIKNENIKR